MGSALALGLGLAAGLPAFAAATAADFLDLARLLTVRPALDAGIAARAFDCLTAEDPAFPDRVTALAAAVRRAGFTDMRGFHAFAGVQDPQIGETAMKIISALYLGYTGTPSGNSTVDDARFVSYQGALMYEPTIDATVIPSFARGATNYWAKPPASVLTD